MNRNPFFSALSFRSCVFGQLRELSFVRIIFLKASWLGRGEPLKRDVRVSSSEDQIREIATAFVEKNIKKDWEQFEG